MADSIQGAMQAAMADVSASEDVRPVGSSSDTRPTEPITETLDGIRPADGQLSPEVVAEVTEQPSGEKPPVQPEKKVPEHIPYDRFQEVVRERNEARQRFDDSQRFYNTLSPQQRTLLENPQLLQDPVRLNAFLYGEQQTQKEVVPDFDAIDDPYERLVAVKEYELSRKFEEQQKPLIEKLQSLENSITSEKQLRVLQDGHQLLAVEEAQVKGRPEFAGVSDTEKASVLAAVKEVARFFQGAMPLTEAYKLTPHYERLMERHFTAKALAVQQGKRNTTTPGIISAGAGNMAPAAVNSTREAYDLAVQRATTG